MAENVTSAKATAKMVRVSSRKVRLVLDTIRNKSVAEAFAILKFTPNGAAQDGPCIIPEGSLSAGHYPEQERC